MKLWRVQLGKWRKAKELEIPLLDITVKSGEVIFAPSWGDVKKYKASKKTVDDIAVYVVKYYEKLNFTMANEEVRFKEVLNMDKVAIACYCKQTPDIYCHLETFEEACRFACKKLGIEYEYMGILE